MLISFAYMQPLIFKRDSLLVLAKTVKKHYYARFRIQHRQALGKSTHGKYSTSSQTRAPIR